MAFARNLKFWNNNKGTEVSDQGGELLLTSEHTPAVVDFDSFAQRARQGTATPEDFEAQKAAIEERFPHSGKTSLLGRIADATRNLKDAALHKITMPKTPASEAVVEHVPAKKSWREKLSGISEKTATGLSAAKAKTTDWTKARAYEARSFGSFIGSTPNTVAKGVTGHDIADIKNYGALSVVDASSKVSGFFSRAREKFRQAPIETDTAPKAEPSEKTGTVLKSIGSYFNRVQRSLRDPATVAQTAACAGFGVLAKYLASSVVTTLAGTSLAATGGLAVVGGAGIAYLNGHLRSEFAKAKAAMPQEEPAGYDNRTWLKRNTESLIDFTKFSAKYMRSGNVIKNMRSEWKEDKKAVLIRTGIGAAFGAAGFGIAAQEEIGKFIHGLMNPDALPSASPAELIITDADKIPLAPPETQTPQIEVPVPTVEPSALDKAIAIIQEKPISADVKEIITQAQNGNSEAMKQIAHIINTDGVASDDHLIEGILEQAEHARNIITPEPSLKLDLSDVVPETTTETAPELPVDPSIFSPDAIKYAIGGGSVVAAGTLAAPLVQSGLMAASMATSKPVEAPRAPEVAQMCKVIDKPDAPGLVDLKCGTPRLEIMNPRDAIGFERQASGEPTRIEYFVLDSQNSYRTLDIEESIVNDTRRFSDIVRKLRGQASGLFNQAASLLPGQPAAQNDNQPAEIAQAPTIALGRDFK